MDEMPGRFPPPPEYTPPAANGARAGGPFPLDLNRMFELIFSLFRFRWRTYLVAAFAIMIPVSIVYAIVDLYVADAALDWYTQFQALAAGEAVSIDSSVLGALGVGLLAGAFLAIATFVAEAAITHASFATFNGQPASAGRSVRFALGRIGALTVAYLLTFLAALAIAFVGVVIASLLFIATSSGGRITQGPGVFFGLIIFVAAFALLIFITIRWSLVVPAIVIEGVGGVESLRRSWRIVSGSTWRVLAYLIVFGLVFGLVAAVLGAALTIVVNPASLRTVPVAIDPVRSAIVTFGTSLISVLLMPFTAIGVMLLYLDLRFRRGEPLTQAVEEAVEDAPIAPEAEEPPIG